MKTYKTKLKLNNEQRTRLFKNADVSRFAYNLTLEIQETNYKNGGKFLSDCDIRKMITVRKVILADRFYHSSQICSHCGNRKVNLRLSERTYKCPICGLEIDRDLNASINLKHYPEFQGKSSLWRAKTTGVAGNSKTEFCEEGILQKADNCSVQLETFIS